ncbi:hypothetical protein MA9V1_106 [Chryseobacterium phage MA9V-1]|nr:hypothetical protein MA9V1_106 [Chryseobacterium phage MA9V-1]
MGRYNFNITGDYLENFMKDCFKSGSFKTFYELCQDNGFNETTTKHCFTLAFTMTGESREDTLAIDINVEQPEDYAETLWIGLKSSIPLEYAEFKHELAWHRLFESDESMDLYFRRHPGALGNICKLVQYVSRETIVSLLRNKFFEEEGYEVTTLAKEIMSGRSYGVNGVIAQDGTFLACGFQDHINMLPVAKSLGLVETDDVMAGRESNAIHISSNSYSGGASHYFSSPEYYDYYDDRKISNAQIETVWNSVDELNRFYLNNSGLVTVGDSCMKLYAGNANSGAKFGNLEFLKHIVKLEERFDIKLPSYANVLTDELANAEAIIVRTSPKKSMPGLLESIVIVEPTLNKIGKACEQIEADFDKHNSNGRNKIHFMFQEFIEGINGVAHIDYCQAAETGDYRHQGVNFRYAASEKQGDVVNGVKSSTAISYENAVKLEKFMKFMATRMFAKIQVEFVEDNAGQLYVLQIRTFLSEKVSNASKELYDSYAIHGKTFCQGNAYKDEQVIAISDVLVVNSEATSEQLKDKKCLVVLEDTDFSHILALSYAFNIPAIYAIQEKDMFNKKLSENRYIVVNTRYQEGLINFV